MLKGFDEDLAAIELPDEIKNQVLELANKRTEGLINKNSELLEKVTQKETLTASEKAKLAELEKFQASALQQQEVDKGNYQAALEMSKTEAQKQLDALAAELNNYKSEVTTYKVDNALLKELDGVKINPAMKDTVFKAMKADANLVDGKAMIGEKSLSEYVQEWSQTDTGKAFCLADVNQGGEGRGGDKPPAQSTPQSNLAQRLKAKGLT